MLKAVFFDLDGTLVNSIFDLGDCVNSVLARFGFPGHSYDEYKYFVGDGIPKLIERALPSAHHTAEEIETCFGLFMSGYREHCLDKTRPYDGIEDVLARLKSLGIKTGVVSNKVQEMTELVTEKLFGPVFDCVYGKREGLPAKPDPAVLLAAAKELSVSLAECALVGDSGTDMLTAVGAGALPLGALWGFRTAKELQQCGAKILLKTPAEIIKITEELNAK